jgi:hypothetical protein
MTFGNAVCWFVAIMLCVISLVLILEAALGVIDWFKGKR